MKCLRLPWRVRFLRPSRLKAKFSLRCRRATSAADRRHGSRIAARLPTMRYTTQFLLSALSAAQFPAPSVPEIAFLGRSNVGKSSLLNALVGDKAAKVSSTPGRTRAINFFLVSDERHAPRKVLADLPGYGYAKISKSISAEWPSFIEPYHNERETLALCVCLVDTNIPPQESD